MLLEALIRGWLAVAGQPPEPEHDPAQVRELADEIMSRPEYREPPEPLPERIIDWLGDRIGDAASGLTLGGVLPAVVAWAILFVLVAAASALLVFGLRHVTWRRGPRARREEATVISAAQRHRSPADWLGEAERHERAGRWREGLLCRYRALVTQLVARGAIDEVVGRTAGEYVQDVSARWPDAAPAFVAATDLFETVWYGGAASGPGERDRFATLADRTLALLTRDRVAAGGRGAGG